MTRSDVARVREGVLLAQRSRRKVSLFNNTVTRFRLGRDRRGGCAE